MALQNLTGFVSLPGLPHWGGSTAFTTVVLDAAGEKCAFVFKAPKTGLIRKLGFKTGTVTTGATYDVRLESVSTSTGNPSGSLFATNTNGSQVIANADDNVWFYVTLTADASVTVNDTLALVLAAPGGSMQIAAGYGGLHTGGMPYVTADLNGAGYATQSVGNPAFYIEYHDTTTAQVGNCLLSTQTTTSFNSGSTPDQRALYFQVPFTCKLGGFEILMGAMVASSAFDVVLYDSDGTTALATTSFDGDQYRTATTNYCFGRFATPVTLTVNTNYRLAVKPTTTNNVGLVQVNYDTTTVMAAVDGGTNFQLSTKTDAGAWSQTADSRPCISLLFSALDDGVSSGGRPEFRGGNL